MVDVSTGFYESSGYLRLVPLASQNKGSEAALVHKLRVHLVIQQHDHCFQEPCLNCDVQWSRLIKLEGQKAVCVVATRLIGDKNVRASHVRVTLRM